MEGELREYADYLELLAGDEPREVARRLRGMAVRLRITAEYVASLERRLERQREVIAVPESAEE